MAHQSLYRRYRPQRFDEIKGQEHVVRALRNAAAEGRVGHAYLFSGPRGTGKTSTARILAKVLNCTNVVDGEPCGECESCVAIEAGGSFDVTELDAASNRRIDDVRDLIATTALASPGRTRLYILDEVHMLTKEASAALLKTLEEPPDHVVFVLATTDPQLVLPTIRSRTQHLEFTLLPADDLGSLVTEVVSDAGLDVDDEGVARALRDGAGSARDTLSALDRIVAAGGVVDEGGSLAEMMDALADRDTGAALVALHESIERGRDPRVVGERLLGTLRDAFLTLMQGDVSHLTEAAAAEAREHADRLRAPAITRALEEVGEALVEMRQSADPRVPLEVALVKLTRPELDPSPTALVERVERLERQARSGGSTNDTGASPAEATERPPSTGGAASPATAARERLAATAGPDEAGAAAPEPGPAGDDAPPEAASKPRPVLGRRSREPTEAPAVDRASAAPDREADTAPPGELDGAASEPAGASGDTSPEGSGGGPSRDDLVLAWGDTILDNLRPKHRALFAAGHFVDVTGGVAAFALPNDAHRGRCEPHRADVQQVLSDHFGAPVELRLVTEGAGPPPVDAGPKAATGVDAPPTVEAREEETIDVTDLEDADAAASGVDQLAEVFGAVDVVDESGEDTP